MTDTLLLRALAGLLIVNSHLEAYYPFGPLAADGLLGDSLFFMLSGFGLALSEMKAKRRFSEWYGRRISRLYPALLLTVFVFDYLIGGGWKTWSATDVFLNAAWGLKYPFFGQILTFYVAFFLLMRLGRPRVFPSLTAALFVPYAVIPVLGHGEIVYHAFHWLFYFQMMLFGATLAHVSKGGARAVRWEPAALIAVGLLYLIVRIAARSVALDDWFFLPHLLVFPVAFLLARLVRSRAVQRFFSTRPWATRAVGFLGGITLELYLMHYQVLRIDAIRSLVFPLNVAVFVAISIGAAAALARATAFLRSAARFGAPVSGGSNPWIPIDRGEVLQRWRRSQDGAGTLAFVAPGGDTEPARERGDEARDELEVLRSHSRHHH